MSMIEIGSTTPSTTAANEANRLQWASAVARLYRIRRGQLGLTIDQAAELSGLEQSQWVAMEDGSWFPEEYWSVPGDCTTLADPLVGLRSGGLVRPLPPINAVNHAGGRLRSAAGPVPSPES